ncbi:hypothetical protein evm_008362 [Chilo suppressalis]|nr:hypothetical protein evm_008362 [Chilo suppressalis]
MALKWLIASFCATSVLAIQEEYGPHYFAMSTPKPNYVMKDVILYLTPTQIKALEATQGLNKVVPYGKPADNKNENVQFSEEDIQNLQSELNRQLEHLRIYGHNERPVEIKEPPPIVEPNTEKAIPFAPQYNQEQQVAPQPEPDYYVSNEQELKVKLPESYSYIKFFTNNIPEKKPDVQVFKPYPHDLKLPEGLEGHDLEIQKDPIHQKDYKLIPYEYVEKKNSEQLKQELETQVPQWPNIFDQLLSEPKPAGQQFYQEQKASESQEESSDIRYTANFDDEKQAADFQRFVNQIENENALAKAEAIRRPTVEVNIEETEVIRKPPSGFKHYNIPELKPFYRIPLTNPVESKDYRSSYQVPIVSVQGFPLLKKEKN